jgi:hypothetical protein
MVSWNVIIANRLRLLPCSCPALSDGAAHAVNASGGL